MATKAERKIVGRLTQPQYKLLRDLTDPLALDAARLETDVEAVVRDRIQLASAMVEAARVLAGNGNPLIRRSAVSRAYYAAYHVARAAVFAVHHRDEDGHEKLPAEVDKLPDQMKPLGGILKELRRLRSEMDYSPYPGPDPESQYEPDEIEQEIRNSIEAAERLIVALTTYLEQRQ